MLKKSSLYVKVISLLQDKELIYEKFILSRKVGGGAILSSLTEFIACKNLNVCYNGDILHHYYKGFKLKKFAFTLAEVLITLGIIGVVAAMTMPALVANYQKTVTVNRLKKAYSVMSNAFVTSQDENGDMNTWGMNNIGSVSDGYENVIPPFLQNYVIKYLDVSIDCGLKCERQKNVKRYWLNGNEWSWYSVFEYVIYLKDGTIVSFMVDNNSKQWMIVRLYVDINGDARPNVCGKDIFTFKLDMDGKSALNMSGVTEVTQSKKRSTLLGTCRECCNKNAGDYAGDFCAGLIQYDGWKIKNDYPWQ